MKLSTLYRMGLIVLIAGLFSLSGYGLTSGFSRIQRFKNLETHRLIESSLDFSAIPDHAFPVEILLPFEQIDLSHGTKLVMKSEKFDFHWSVDPEEQASVQSLAESLKEEIYGDLRIADSEGNIVAHEPITPDDLIPGSFYKDEIVIAGWGLLPKGRYVATFTICSLPAKLASSNVGVIAKYQVCGCYMRGAAAVMICSFITGVMAFWLIVESASRAHNQQQTASEADP